MIKAINFKFNRRVKNGPVGYGMGQLLNIFFQQDRGRGRGCRDARQRRVCLHLREDPHHGAEERDAQGAPGLQEGQVQDGKFSTL